MEDFAAKPAAHIRRNDAQLVFRNFQREGAEQHADGMRVLAGGPDCHLVVRRIPLRHAGARLNGVGDEARVD